MSVEAMFLGQLEGAKGLFLSDKKQVIVKDGVNDSVARMIERR
ncbi:hypothetical protein [Paraburkholderia sediminicola]